MIVNTKKYLNYLIKKKDGRFEIISLEYANNLAILN